MISKDSIEAAYSFFHQKERIYAASSIERQRDDIEFAIGEYAGDMNRELYEWLAGGRRDFLFDHSHFEADLQSALEKLSQMIS